jgi:tagatose 1,6-diphosphate aldolase
LEEKISAGKRKGLEAVSDSHGVIAAVAIDQRSALRNLLARSMEITPENVPAEKLIQFKEAVSRILTPHASAILLDPEYGLSASRQRARSTGLLLAYEKTGYDKKVPGRLPRLLDHWSVPRLVEAGADCIKLLLYYSTSSSPEINETKQALVARVGAECAAADIPFFLELVSYAEGLQEKSIDFARAKPGVVIASMAEFSNPRYRVDVLKVGVPIDLAYVEKSPTAVPEILHTRQQAKTYFLQAAEVARVPFLYLSEGVSNATFQFGLKLAAEAGAPFSGVLCGRATWKDGVPVLVERGMAALEDWLAQDGVRNIENINRQLLAATPWFAYHRVSAAG